MGRGKEIDHPTVKSFGSKKKAKDESITSGISERNNIMEWPISELGELSSNERWGNTTKT